MIGAYETDGPLYAALILLGLWGIWAIIKHLLASRVDFYAARLRPLAKRLKMGIEGDRIRGFRGGTEVIIAGSGEGELAIRLAERLFPKHLRLGGEATTTGADPDRWRLAILTEAEQAQVVAALDQGWTVRGGRLHRTLPSRDPLDVEAALAVGLRLGELVSPHADELERLLIAVRLAADPTPALALDALCERHGHHPETARVVAEVLNDPQNGPRLELKLRALLAMPDAPDAPTALAGIVAHGYPADLAPDVASALGVVPHPDAEALLLAGLRSSDDKVVAAVIDSLANVGTVAAVAALLPLRDAPSRHRRRAAEAILAIQSRVGPNAGGLALAAGGGGELAVIASEPGPDVAATEVEVARVDG